eukprot:13609633-Alexandrium_andersonii.AAC.1
MCVQPSVAMWRPLACERGARPAVPWASRGEVRAFGCLVVAASGVRVRRWAVMGCVRVFEVTPVYSAGSSGELRRECNSLSS